MQNKTVLNPFHKSHSNSTYYRSIRYRVNTTTITQSSKRSTLEPNQAYLKTMKESIVKKVSSLSAGKVTPFKRYATVESEENRKKIKKMSYLQTWRTLLDKVQFKGIDCTIENKNDVTLPAIKEFQQSQFTLFDSMNLSINFIENEIIKANRDLLSGKNEIKNLKGELMTIHNRIDSQLDQTREIISQEISKLKQSLVIDNIRQQETKLRNRRQCKILQFQDKQFKKSFQNSKQKIGNLQEVIFQAKPYDLQIIDQQIFPQKTQYI